MEQHTQQNISTSGHQALIHVGLLFVFLLFILAACSGDKKKDAKSHAGKGSNTEALAERGGDATDDLLREQGESSGGAQSAKPDAGFILLTFSLSNLLQEKSEYLRLGLYEIYAHVRVGESVRMIPLYGQDPQIALEFSDALTLSLSSLREDMYLYQGTFPVPAGTLEAVTVQFSGSQSLVLLNGRQVELIDAFGFSALRRDNTLPSRLFPEEVTTGAAVEIKKGELEVVNIEIDRNLSLGEEAYSLANPGRPRGVFTPSIRVTSPPSPFNFVIDQTEVVEISNDVLALGSSEDEQANARGFFLTDIELGASPSLFIDGLPAETPDFSGLAKVTLTGELTPGQWGANKSPHRFVIQSGMIHKYANESREALFQGEVTIDADNQTFTLKGIRQSLAQDEEGLRGITAFEGEIPGRPGDLGLVDGSSVTLWSNSVHTRVLATPNRAEETGPSSQKVLTLRSTVFNTPADLLGLEAATNDETRLTITLPSPIDCNLYVRGLSGADTCNGRIETLVFNKSTEGLFSILEARRADAYTLRGETDYELGTDRSLHFTDLSAFTQRLHQKVTEDGYRVAALLTAGAVEDSRFTVGNVAKVILFQPQALLDSKADNVISAVARANGTAATTIDQVVLGGVSAGVARNFLTRKNHNYTLSKPRKILHRLQTMIDAFTATEIDFHILDLGGNIRRFRVTGLPEGVRLTSPAVNENGALVAMLSNAAGDPVEVGGQPLPSDLADIPSVLINRYGEISYPLRVPPVSDRLSTILLAPDNPQESLFGVDIYLLKLEENQALEEHRDQAVRFGLDTAVASPRSANEIHYVDEDGQKIILYKASGTLLVADGSKIGLVSIEGTDRALEDLESRLGGLDWHIGKNIQSAYFVDNLQHVKLKTGALEVEVDDGVDAASLSERDAGRSLGFLYDEHLGGNTKYSTYEPVMHFDSGYNRWYVINDEETRLYPTHIVVTDENDYVIRYVLTSEAVYGYHGANAIRYLRDIRETRDKMTIKDGQGNHVIIHEVYLLPGGLVEWRTPEDIFYVDTYGSEDPNSVMREGTTALSLAEIHTAARENLQNQILIRREAIADYPRLTDQPDFFMDLTQQLHRAWKASDDRIKDYAERLKSTVDELNAGGKIHLDTIIRRKK